MKNKVMMLLLAGMLSAAVFGCSSSGSASGSGTSQTADEKVEDEAPADEEEEEEDSEKAEEANETDESDKEEEIKDSSQGGTGANLKDDKEKSDEAVDATSSASKKGSGDSYEVDDRPTPADASLNNSSLGPVYFTPTMDSNTGMFPRGSSLMHAYFKRTGVKGNGQMEIYYSADNDRERKVDLTKPKNCYEGKDDGTFKMLGWDGGTHLIIDIGDPIENSASFYVLLEEGAFASSDGKILSKEVSDNKVWSFDVQDFGVDLAVKNGKKVYIGDEVYARIFIRRPAKKVFIENYDENRLSFNEKEFKNEDGDLRIKVKQLGEDTFYINYYDSDKNLLASIPVTYEGVIKPDEKEQKEKHNVVGL